MRKLLILVALVGYCATAPTIEKDEQTFAATSFLQRPSPINPDILSDPKPTEKIITVTNSKETVQHKRESVRPIKVPTNQDPITVNPTPSVDLEAGTTPTAHHHSDEKHRQKRDNKQSTLDAKNQRPPSAKPNTPTKNVKKPNNKLGTTPLPPQHSHNVKNSAPVPVPPKKSTLEKHRQKRDEFNTQQHGHASAVESTSLHHEQDSESKSTTLNQHAVEPHILPANLAAVHLTPIQEHKETKRDIPVPSNEKQPQELTKVIGDTTKHEQEAEKPKKPEDEKDEVQVEDLSGGVPQHHPLQSTGQQHDQAHTQHALHHQHEFRPQHPHPEHKQQETVSESSVITPTTEATTQHPVIRPHPVPVAELFARPKQKADN